MDPTTQAAADRIRAAIDGRPFGPGGRPRLAEVCPADVLAVAARVAQPTAATAGLAKGAAGALEGVPEDLAGEQRVYQYAHQLAELLEKAGAA